MCDDLNDFIRNQFPGIHIRTATEGFQAGWIARGWKPNIVLLDLMLPGIDGFHVCRIIRAFQELAHTKVIVITGRGNGQRDKSFASGAVDYLTKPLDYTMLEQILKYRLYGT
ncbi:MAG: hypothetical protein A2Z83_02075 [Omnitrophica bacterium GWA2_52_8]|nr:MAG: hypothetical protein A2Z83_02075 [Omnitrophica bacterium GWA2_52_8]